MKKIISIIKAGRISKEKCQDIIILDYDNRNKRRSVMKTENNQKIILDLKNLKVIDDQSVFVLDDDSYVFVKSKPEKLLQITANNSKKLNQIIWHIGNRHTAAEIENKIFYISYDYVLEDMIIKLGGKVESVKRPFNPEKGAYNKGHKH